MCEIKIAVIDSGLPLKKYSRNRVNGFSVSYSSREKTYKICDNDYQDEIGHGSAVVDIFEKHLEGTTIDMFKIFTNEFETDEESLIYALEYIKRNNVYHLLHISSGILQPERYFELKRLCETISQQGTIIVSAFDNDGAVSYPAAFPCVIGVDMSESRLKHDEYEIVENSIINVRGSASFHRVLWKNSENILVQGASFSSVYVSIRVIQIMRQGVFDFNKILSILRNSAKKYIFTPRHMQYDASFVSGIKRAIVFPFNKENHALFRYKAMLPFKIIGVFDSKYSLQVGRKVSEVQPDVLSDDCIQDVDLIDWNSDFDTVILGHTNQISELSKKNYREQFIDNCCLHGKKLFSYDDFQCTRQLSRYIPKITTDMVPQNRFGKMRLVSVPVLGVWGTSSQQGKFSLQLKLRSELQQQGYRVGWLSTEPHGGLFGAERVYPVGYNSTVNITDIQAVVLLNEFMWEISCLGTDIVLVGSQSGTVPYSFLHLSSYPLYQNDILFATQPDYILLCVNSHDDYEYIQRTINYLESSIDSKVIGLVLFPCTKEGREFMQTSKTRMLTQEETDIALKKLSAKFGIKSYTLNSEELVHDVIKSFLEV